MTRTTATPWYHDQPQGEIKGANGKPVAYVFVHEADELGQGVTGANAAHIVRCVNLHEGLVEALRLALTTIQRLTVNHGPFNSTQGTQDVINAALVRATQEER